MTAGTPPRSGRRVRAEARRLYPNLLGQRAESATGMLRPPSAELTMQATASSSGERAGAVNAGQVGAALAIWTAVVTIAFWEDGVRFVPAPALVPPMTAALLIAL